jgi:glyoxylase-like metal-dependent hydrolase (beta-lactamase superfamily II)
MTLNATIIPVTPFEQNCTVVWCDETMLAAAVDPGGDLDQIEALLKEEGLILEKVLITHGHIDHAGGAAELAERAGVPIEGPHPDDQYWIDLLPEHGRNYGFVGARSFTPSRWLHDGDTVTVGNERFEVRHCPGHTPGHVVFFHRGKQLALVGDVLFQGSIGRSDFPRGNPAALIRSIREKLFPLGDAVRFVPGHGPMSSFGEERQHNPYVSDSAVARSTG